MLSWISIPILDKKDPDSKAVEQIRFDRPPHHLQWFEEAKLCRKHKKICSKNEFKKPR